MILVALQFNPKSQLVQFYFLFVDGDISRMNEELKNANDLLDVAKAKGK